MDEEKLPAAESADAPSPAMKTDRRGRARRAAAWLLAASALVLLVASALLFTVRIGRRLYLCAGEADVSVSHDVLCIEVK